MYDVYDSGKDHMAPSEGNKAWIFFLVFSQPLRIFLMRETYEKFAE